MKSEKSKENIIKSYNNKDKFKKENRIIQLDKKLSSSPLSKKNIKNNIFTFKTDKVKEKELVESPKLIYEKDIDIILSSESSSKSPNSDYKKYLSNNKNTKEALQNKKILFINDIIGEDSKKPIDKIYNKINNNFIKAKSSTKSYGIIKAYSVNTNQGIIRNYNEDRVSIVINMSKPNYYKNGLKWPKLSYFAIFDGHGGNKCAEYLRDNLLKLIIENKNFPSNINLSIKEAIHKADNDFLNNIAVRENKIVDYSGSCCLFLLIINNIGYIINVGDSRCLISYNNGKIKKGVTRDHKPNYSYEKERIIDNGGIIYQSQNKLNNILNGKILLGPYRVIPGRLSVSRTIGDAEAKLKIFGGNPNIVICEPDIYSFNIEKENVDYIILGCDGIFDQLSNDDIFECVSLIINNNNKKENDLHKICGDIVNLILNASMERKSFDNVTCIFICFKNLLNINNNNINNFIKKSKVSYNRNNSYIITLSSSKSTKNTINVSLDSKNNKLNYRNENDKSIKGKKSISPKQNSEKNRFTIDYPNQVKKRIISTKHSNSNIFNNHNKIKKVINNNAKFVKNTKKHKHDNTLKSSYSVKYYTITDQYKNNFNIKNEKKKIESIDIYLNNKRNSSKNKRIVNKSNCKEKVSRTEENKKNEKKKERKNKSFKKSKIKLNIFNLEIKNNSNKSQKNKKINYKINESTKNLCLNYFKNPSSKKNNIIDVKKASINLDLKEDLSKTNIKLKKNLSSNHNLKKKYILKNE